MRRALTLTKREQRQVERQLKKLDAAYQAGRVNEMIYKHKRAQLISNLSRPKAAITPIEANQKGFFQTRRNMEFGPVPVGYWKSHPKLTCQKAGKRQQGPCISTFNSRQCMVE